MFENLHFLIDKRLFGYYTINIEKNNCSNMLVESIYYKGDFIMNGRNERYTARTGRRAHRRAYTGKKRLFLSLLAAFIVCAVFGNGLVSAHGNREEEPVNFKYYKSITIESGDTLWQIAADNMTDDFDSVEEYMYELMDMNHLKDDQIKAGDKIIIAYNDTTYIQ